jgi:FSR family fosmidomycin resistance protein-like MFS transporter
MKSKYIVPLFSVVHFSHHLSTGVLVPLLPLLRQDLGLNYFQAGVLVSSFSLSYGFGQLPMALLADRFSSIFLIVIGLIGTSLSSVAVSLTNTYWQMIPCFIILGLLGSTYHAPAASFLSQSVPQAQRGRSLGTHTIGGSASFLLTPVMAVTIATQASTWRLSFLLLAIPALVMGILLWFATRKPHETGQIAERAQLNPPTGGSNPGTDLAANPNPTVTWRQIIQVIGVLALISISMQVVFSSVHSYLPLYLVDRHGIAPEYAGIVVGLVAGAGIVGAPLGGALSDRMGRKKVILLSLSLAGPLLFAVIRASSNLWLSLSLLTYGAIISARMPAMESLIADVVPARRRATVLGIYYLAGQETAGVLTPLVGRLIDLGSPDPVFAGLAAGLCIISVIALTFRKRI